MASTTGTDWHLQGQVLLACNCEPGCPCNFNNRPTHGHCQGGWTWHVEDGHLGDIRLDGRTFSMLGDWPGALHEGNGEALLLIDERADDRQYDAITRFLRGEIGGPWQILVNTITTYHGPKRVPVAFDGAGDRSRVQADGVLELATEPIRNPVTHAETHPRIVLPEGFVWRDGLILSSTVFRVEDGIAYDHSGHYAALAPFEYPWG